MMENYTINPQVKTLLLVDDEATNLHALKQILQGEYHLLFATTGELALEICKLQQPDLILLDVMLGGISGYEVCRAIKTDAATARIPVIFVSSMSDSIDEAQGFTVGGVDYIAKPVSPVIVKARVATHLTLVRTEELQKTQLQIIQRLGRAAEYKDNETGLHVIRMSHYSRLLALAAGFSEQAANELLHASPMHDVGKIGIPDQIMLKPGPLNDEEWIIMRRHPAIGSEIIGEHDSPLLKAASVIALTHHEKFDGSGYPNRLKGDEIPVIGRIVAIADVFDALTSERPYKKAWPVEEALALIRRESGRHFDPELVLLFLQIMPEVLNVMQRWSDKAAPDRMVHS